MPLKRCTGELLDRLIPPLFCQPTNNQRDYACEEVTTKDNQENNTRTDDAKKRQTDRSSLPNKAVKDKKPSSQNGFSKANGGRLVSLQQ